MFQNPQQHNALFFLAKKMADFLQHMRDGEFTLSWDTALIQPPYDPKCPGLVGRYGVGYGHEDHKRDIQNKYGIHSPGFILPNAIELKFSIRNRKGYDFLCHFADSFGYKRPTLHRETIRGAVKHPVKLERAEAENKTLTQRVAALCAELNELTDLDIDTNTLDINNIIDTEQFYEHYDTEVYPFDYGIVETNKQQINDIWFETFIMRDC